MKYLQYLLLPVEWTEIRRCFLMYPLFVTNSHGIKTTTYRKWSFLRAFTKEKCQETFSYSHYALYTMGCKHRDRRPLLENLRCQSSCGKLTMMLGRKTEIADLSILYRIVQMVVLWGYSTLERWCPSWWGLCRPAPRWRKGPFTSDDIQITTNCKNHRLFFI